MKLEESHLDDYLADNEYAVTYIDGEGKEKQIKFKPNKNTNIAGIQKQLGETYKDFFKLKEIKGGEKMQESKNIKDLTLAERILLNAIKTVNSAYDLDNVVCTTIPSTGDVLVSTKDGKDICTIARHKFAINGDDTKLIDELREDGYWEDDLDELDEEELIECDTPVNKITEASALSAKDEANTVIVNKNQFGYNTIAIIIDDINKRYQLVSGQSLPNGRYKKASKKAIRQKAEDLKASGYTEVKGPNSLSESVELKTGSAEDIMKGKAFSVKDTEILNTVMDALKSELGPDWEGKSLIDIEDITFNTIDEYSKDHNEDIDPQPYYTQLKMLIGRNDLSEGKDTKSDELSKEDIVNLLDNGHILTAGKKNYTPTEFLSEKGKIYFNNREISFGWQEHPSLKTADDLADFLLNLQKEGFEVTHSDRTEKDTITESASKEDTLTKLANKILDFYGEDMGNYFDEIAGKEEDVFNNILSSLENKDESDINKFIEDMEEDEGNEDTVNQLKSILNECKETLIEKDEVDEPDTVIEYSILFENGDDEFYSDKEEADKRFQEIIDNGNLEDVVQYYKKEWIKGEKDYEEGDVEVYYTEGDILHEELFGASDKVYQDSKEKGLYSENLK